VEDGVSRMLLDRHISVSVTDHTGRQVNLSEFGTLLSGDIADGVEKLDRSSPPKGSIDRSRFGCLSRSSRPHTIHRTCDR
jgi:hypothetical protein